MTTKTQPAIARADTSAAPHHEKVHIVITGKGGVGKSFYASLLHQYALARSNAASDAEARPRCFDTDPVNRLSLGRYKSLASERIELLDGVKINPREFDRLFEGIRSSKGPVVVDSGASAYTAFLDYILFNGIADFLQSRLHRELVLHTVVVGGEALLETLQCLDTLAGHFPKQKMVVVINPYFGPVQLDGKQLEDMQVYAKHKSRIAGLVRIPRADVEYTGRDIREMQEAGETLTDRVQNPQVAFVAGHRLEMYQREMYAQLDALAAAGIL